MLKICTHFCFREFLKYENWKDLLNCNGPIGWKERRHLVNILKNKNCKNICLCKCVNQMSESNFIAIVFIISIV